MEVGQTWLRRTALIYLQALLLVGDKRPCVSVSRERWLWLELCVSWFPALWLPYVQENVYIWIIVHPTA